VARLTDVFRIVNQMKTEGIIAEYALGGDAEHVLIHEISVQSESFSSFNGMIFR